MSYDLMNLRSVIEYTGLSKPTLYRSMSAGQFPRPLQISRGRVAWRRVDVERWYDRLSVSEGLSNA